MGPGIGSSSSRRVPGDSSFSSLPGCYRTRNDCGKLGDVGLTVGLCRIRYFGLNGSYDTSLELSFHTAGCWI